MEHSQDIINECWRSIDGYINYQVSNTGRVRNALSGKILSEKRIDRYGYVFMALCQDGIKKEHRVHKLVADHFIPKPQGIVRLEVDHLDRNKTNNAVTNLMWKTSRQNKWNRDKIKRATSSKYIGVCFDKRDLVWKASVRLNDGRSKHLGLFHREKDAARAYNAKAHELRGNLAVLNDISDNED